MCYPYHLGLMGRHKQAFLDSLQSFNESAVQFTPAGDYFAATVRNGTAHPRRRFPAALPWHSCWEYAVRIPEPLTTRYEPRSSVSGIGDGVPRAYWRWPGKISKADFDKASAMDWLSCIHCMNVVQYKIVGGRLYVAEGASWVWQRDVAEEMLQVVLYLFPIPDMDFILHFGDGCATGLPVINWNVCRQFADAGFTMPSYSQWKRSLGRVQLMAYKACLDKRYPATKRRPLVFWRGSTTDTQAGTFDKSNWQQALRIQLHQFARDHTDMLDVKIASLLNCDEHVKAQINDTGDWVAFEDFNRYCAILDIDGNGWSDRFGQLVHFNTPILKAASNFTGFFEHLMAPGTAIEQFKRDFSDLAEKAAALVADCRAGAVRGRQLAETMQTESALLMDTVGIAEAFAYTLTTYRSLSDWAVSPSLAGFKEVTANCCTAAQVPQAFAAAVTARVLGGGNGVGAEGGGGESAGAGGAAT